MKNRFSHITSQSQVSDAALQSSVSQCETNNVKGKPTVKSIGRNAYDTLMGLLSVDTETPTTPYGVLIANSTKRNLKKQVKELFKP